MPYANTMGAHLNNAGAISFWNAEERKLEEDSKIHRNTISSMTWTASGDRLITGDENGRVSSRSEGPCMRLRGVGKGGGARRRRGAAGARHLWLPLHPVARTCGRAVMWHRARSGHVPWMHACQRVGGWMPVWAGLGWAGLGWAGLGWAGLGWAGLGWTGWGAVEAQCGSFYQAIGGGQARGQLVLEVRAARGRQLTMPRGHLLALGGCAWPLTLTARTSWESQQISMWKTDRLMRPIHVVAYDEPGAVIRHTVVGLPEEMPDTNSQVGQ